MIAILRDQLELRSGQAAEAGNKIAELELRVARVDSVVDKAEQALSGSNAMSADWRQVTRQVTVLSDNILIAYAQVEQAEIKERNATAALVGLEDQLAEAKEALGASQGGEAELRAENESLKVGLHKMAAEKRDAQDG